MTTEPTNPLAEGDEEILAFGKWLCAQEPRFMLGVAALKQLPPEDLPEICFAGRSNVGKSSLINAILSRNSVARTSNTPGRTQQLNFFNLAERLIMVDLPGYGFAKAPKDMVDSWNRLLKDYLRGRVKLKRVFVLIDSRHGIKQTDDEMMKMLDSTAVPYQVVLTKADKLKPGQMARRAEEVTAQIRKHPAALPVPLVTSSEKGLGIDTLRAELGAMAEREAKTEPGGTA